VDIAKSSTDSRVRVVLIMGTRPEAIKMAPVVKALQGRPDEFDVRVCVTAQHREMLDQVLQVFDIEPDIDLDLMRPQQGLSALAARVLAKLDPVLADTEVDWVLVQGDTTTVAAAAIAAQHRQIHVGHIEAGLRTWDRRNPFPEEMNRVVTDHISDLCFAPTTTAVENLLREGIAESCIVETGNTVIDALLMASANRWLPEPRSPLAGLTAERKLLLVTAHRRENHGQPLRDICAALRTIASERDGEVQIVYPVHLNPKVWAPVHDELSGTSRILLLPPVSYQEMVYLLGKSHMVLTDSGGLQEEAPALGKPVLVLRKTTERPEAAAIGASKVIGTDPTTIVQNVYRLLDDSSEYTRMSSSGNPYGDGRASQRIADALLLHKMMAEN